MDEKTVPLDHIVGNNQVIVNKVHRHEPPVTTQPLAILFETDDYLVVDKPSSIPVHPCGRYRHNTVQALLGHEQQRWGLYRTLAASALRISQTYQTHGDWV